MSVSRLIIIVGSVISLIGMGNPGSDNLYKIESRKLAQNYEISQINDDIVSLTNKITLSNKLFKITPSELILSPQTQIIDLINEDTTKYANRYIYHDEIPIAGSGGSYPLRFGDLNQNGKLDIIGSYLPPEDKDSAKVAIVELQPDQTFQLTKIYDREAVIRTLPLTDVNNDGIPEVNLKIHGGDGFNHYVIDSVDNYPDSLEFYYELWEQTGGPSNEHITDADNDGITDLLYIGQERAYPAGQKVFVAEYDSAQNNFVKRFSYLAECYNVWGLTHGDYDDDGFIEFVTGSIDGDVYVYENTGNDSYSYIFHDTLSTPNAYLVCSGNDIDRNGKTEFFVGGSSYYHEIGGTKVYWFEADGNNNYIKKYTFFLAGTGVLGNTEIFNFDIDANGIDDLVFCFSELVVILSWNQNGYFDIVYLDLVEDWKSSIHSVNIYDVYNTGKPNLIIGYHYIKRGIPYYSHIFKNHLISKVEPIKTDHPLTDYKLFQNYPNPFNNTTNIRLQVPNQENISLTIYDITGKEVRSLIHNQLLNPGDHEIIWDGKNATGKEVASGIYILSMRADDHHSSLKMILSK